MAVWIQAHAVLLVSILGAVVAVDHALASTDLVKSSSTGQAIVASIGKVGDWLLALVSPKP
jgi:hypothetical protein